MQQKFIETNGVKIAYIEKNPSIDKTLFFVHGNSGSSKMWQKQFASDLLDDYRLIAIDLPGHGQSGWSKHPFDDYSPIGTAKLLLDVIRNLVADRPFVLIGFSYGTNVVAEMLEFGHKPSGIVFIGSCVVGKEHGLDKVFKVNETPSIFFYNEMNKELVRSSFAKSLTGATNKELEILTEDYLNVSPDFKPALFKSVSGGKISDEIAALQRLNTPILTLFGTHDSVVNIDYLDDFPFSIWRDHIYKLSGAGHFSNIDRSEEVDHLLSEYIRAGLQ